MKTQAIKQADALVSAAGLETYSEINQQRDALLAITEELVGLEGNLPQDPRTAGAVISARTVIARAKNSVSITNE